MKEQLLKMNGLSAEILDALSFESHLGIPLKKNLHYFDKVLLIAELIEMTDWLDEQEILSDIALDYRVKSLDSMLLKYERYYPDIRHVRCLMMFWVSVLSAIAMTNCSKKNLRSFESLI